MPKWRRSEGLGGSWRFWGDTPVLTFPGQVPRRPRVGLGGVLGLVPRKLKSLLGIPDAVLVTENRYRQPGESPLSGEEGGRTIMAETTNEIAKRRLGPCGVHCGKCYAFEEGDICALSSRLIDSLGNFEVYARRFAELMGEPVFLKYPDFREFLGYLAAAVTLTGERSRKRRGDNSRIPSVQRVRSSRWRPAVNFPGQHGTSGRAGGFPGQEPGSSLLGKHGEPAPAVGTESRDRPVKCSCWCWPFFTCS